MSYYNYPSRNSYMSNNRNRPARTFAPAVALEAQPEPGIYKLDDGTLVKIKTNQSKTNRYSLRGININGVRLNESDEVVNFDYTYAPELRSQCNESNHVTAEEAMSWGIKYGNCMACGRTLKDAKSVKQGIGPVCIKYFRF